MSHEAFLEIKFNLFIYSSIQTIFNSHILDKRHFNPSAPTTSSPGVIHVDLGDENPLQHILGQLQGLLSVSRAREHRSTSARSPQCDGAATRCRAPPKSVSSWAYRSEREQPPRGLTSCLLLVSAISFGRLWIPDACVRRLGDWMVNWELSFLPCGLISCKACFGCNAFPEML